MDELKEQLDRIEMKIDTIKNANEDLMNAEECAKFLSLTLQTIYAKVRMNQLPYFKEEKKVYFSRKEIIKQFKTNRKNGRAIS